MYSVHHWLERSLQSHPWRVEGLRTADVVVVNASFAPFNQTVLNIYRVNYERRRCYNALQVFAEAVANYTPPRARRLRIYATMYKPDDHLVKRFGTIPGVRWVTNEYLASTPVSQNHIPPVNGTSVIVAPHVVSSPRWLVEGVPPAGTGLVPWDERKLLFFAGRIPKPSDDMVRLRLYGLLHARPEMATVVSTWSNWKPALRHAHREYGAANVTPVRVSPTEYAAMAMRHKFCLVAQGDTSSTKKLGEAVAFAAVGGCLPLIVHGSALPFYRLIDYESFAAFTHERTLLADLKRLAQVSRREYESRVARARVAQPAFVSRENSSVRRGQLSAAEVLLSEMCATRHEEDTICPGGTGLRG